MTRIRPRLAAAAALLALLPVVQAADTTGRFSVKAPGAMSCDQYVKEREEKSQLNLLAVGWMNGYLSAYNQMREDTFDIAPWETPDLLAALLDQFCRNNPAQPFFTAVVAMSQALYDQRLIVESPRVEARDGDNAVQLYQVVLQRVQERLAALGHYKGKPDGVFGSGTREALKAYQAERKISESGLPDQETLFNLFRGAAGAGPVTTQ